MQHLKLTASLRSGAAAAAPAAARFTSAPPSASVQLKHLFYMHCGSSSDKCGKNLHKNVNASSVRSWARLQFGIGEESRGQCWEGASVGKRRSGHRPAAAWGLMYCAWGAWKIGGRPESLSVSSVGSCRG